MCKSNVKGNLQSTNQCNRKVVFCLHLVASVANTDLFRVECEFLKDFGFSWQGMSQFPTSS